jgi:leader peptidase (prepilin peptidase)/N-methyltransferase
VRKSPSVISGVEALTGLLFLAVWRYVWPDQWVLAFPYWILVSLFIVATFIDFEYFIIPDEITWGGVAAGIVLGLAIPTLHGVESNVMGGVWALVGAATGYLTLWAVVELGKKAFGRKRVTYAAPEQFSWIRSGDEAELQVGGEKQPWSEFFARESDRLLMECRQWRLTGAIREGHARVSL